MIFSTGGLQFFFNKTTFGVERLSIEGDAERVSWVRGREFALPSGNNILIKSEFSPDRFSGDFLFYSGLTCKMTVTKHDGAAVFHYSFKNDTKKDLSVEVGDLGIHLPFNDDFDDPCISLRRRVHAHVRTEGQAYVYCERYSGDLPSLGLLLTKGHSNSYALERGGRKTSRGKVILEFPALQLAVNESCEFEFVIFACKGRRDFYRKAEKYGALTVRTSGLTVFEGEEIVLSSTSATVLRTENGEIAFRDGECRFVAKGSGEHHATVFGGERFVDVTYFVLSRDLPEKRIRFVLDNQYLSEGSSSSAFTAYDVDKAKKVVRGGVRSAFNLGGARATALLLLLRAGEKSSIPAEMRAKIDASVAFYDREIYLGNGVVADDVGGKVAFIGKHYHHYPLYAAIKYEEYRYSNDLSCLKESGAILSEMYRSGAVYEIAPTLAVSSALRDAGETMLADELKDLVTVAADRLICKGNNYEPFKGFSYGPEILCGALSTLLDAYMLTNDERYLRIAKEQHARLEAFSFPSLDYSTDEVPKIFQRNRSNGLTYDMSPHPFAAYAALVSDKYYRVTSNEHAHVVSQRALKSALTLFTEQGGCFGSKALPRVLNDTPLEKYEQISYGEDVVLYFFDLLFYKE